MSSLTASQTEPFSEVTSHTTAVQGGSPTTPLRLHTHDPSYHDDHRLIMNSSFPTSSDSVQAAAAAAGRGGGGRKGEGEGGEEGTAPSAVNMVIRQDPFTITLDAHALLAGSLFLLMGMHFLPRLLLESSILAVPIFLLFKNDYQNFLRLGPGGTPPTLAGYARLTWLRLFILRDPFSPPSSSSSSPFSRPSAGILGSSSSSNTNSNLPYRPGPRPTVAGLAPQRQLNQHGSPTVFHALKVAVTRLAARYPEKFGTATSCLEKHGFALFSRHPVNVCGNGEVVHIHSSDYSMHLNLHPDDIAEVLRKGWSQRHPLAWGRPGAINGGDGGRAKLMAVGEEGRKTGKVGWFPWMRANSPLPETFVLVYAPRDASDLRVVCKIIEAAIWYTVEERVDLEGLLPQSH